MRTCIRCVMDETDPEICFDEQGLCNHCRAYDKRIQTELHYGQTARGELYKVLHTIRTEGHWKPYDCVIGLSGGVDSSYVALKLKEMKIRPLAVIIDNGWDTELGKQNVRELVFALDLNALYVQLNEDRFKDLQLSFLKAGVANVEIPTDHLITAGLYEVAYRSNIRWVVHGGNIVTESIMPESWGYDAKDWRHIKAIQKRFGQYDIDGFAHLTVPKWFWLTFVKKIKWFPILNYIRYDRKKAVEELKAKIPGWQDYGLKHFESLYTRWIQGYFLPKRWNVDKRRAHFSTLINSHQMTRKDALLELEKPINDWYPQYQEDMAEVRAGFGLSLPTFEHYLKMPKVRHEQYPNNKWLWKFAGHARKVAIMAR